MYRPGDGSPIPVDPLSSHYELQTLSGVKTQAVAGINWSHKYNDNDMLVIGGEYFYNQPGYADPHALSGPALQHREPPMLNFFYTGRHYAALFASFPAPYSWNYTTFTLSTLGQPVGQVVRVARRLLGHRAHPPHLRGVRRCPLRQPGRQFRAGFDIPAQTVLGSDGQTCAFYPESNLSPILLDLGVALRIKILIRRRAARGPS